VKRTCTSKLLNNARRTTERPSVRAGPFAFNPFALHHHGTSTSKYRPRYHTRRQVRNRTNRSGPLARPGLQRTPSAPES
jgi:hypothetical protein